jgi:hypothetical protein
MIKGNNLLEEKARTNGSHMDAGANAVEGCGEMTARFVREHLLIHGALDQNRLSCIWKLELLLVVSDKRAVHSCPSCGQLQLPRVRLDL